MSKRENRKERRLQNISIPAKFRINELDPRNKNLYKIGFVKRTISGGKIIDLSASGLSFFSEVPIGLYVDTGSVINLYFMLNDICFEVTGLIVRIDKIENILGKVILSIAVHFMDMSHNIRSSIRNYINSKVMQEKAEQELAMKKEKRLSKRVGAKLFTAFKTIPKSGCSDDSVRTGIGEITYISQGGICFLSKGLFFKFGDTAKLRIHFSPAGDKYVDVTVMISRTTPHKKEKHMLEIGASFLNLSPEAKMAIDEYIAKKEAS